MMKRWYQYYQQTKGTRIGDPWIQGWCVTNCSRLYAAKEEVGTKTGLDNYRNGTLSLNDLSIDESLMFDVIAAAAYFQC